MKLFWILIVVTQIYVLKFMELYIKKSFNVWPFIKIKSLTKQVGHSSNVENSLLRKSLDFNRPSSALAPRSMPPAHPSDAPQMTQQNSGPQESPRPSSDSLAQPILLLQVNDFLFWLLEHTTVLKACSQLNSLCCFIFCHNYSNDMQWNII